jgi:hypothetical protein
MNNKQIKVNHPETRGTFTIGEEVLDSVYVCTEDARGFKGTLTVNVDGRLVFSSSALNILTDDVEVIETAPTPEVETVGPYALGDVLVSSWGYDQTNIDFYQVVGFTKSGKSVRLIAIEGEHVETTGFMSERVRPCPGCPVEGAKSFTKRISPDRDYIALTSYSFARKVDRDTYTATHYA